MSGLRMLRPAAAALLAVVTLAGCGSDADSGSNSPSQTTSVESSAETDADTDADADDEVGAEEDEDSDAELEAGEGTCPDDATAVVVPPDVALTPFPDGAVVYDVETREGAGIILTAVTSMAIKEVLAAMNAAYSTDGYAITGGETEERDAEANWTNGSLNGRWAIRDLTGDCESGTQIQVLVAGA